MNRQHFKHADPALQELNAVSSDAPALLLHRGRVHQGWGFPNRLTHPAPDRPLAWYRYTADGRSCAYGFKPDEPFTHNLFRDLRAVLASIAPASAVGYISYDIARRIEPRKLRSHPAPDGAWPIVELAFGGQTSDCSVADDPPPAPSLPEPAELVAQLTADFSRPEYEAAVQRVIDYIAAGDVFQVNLAQRFSVPYIGDPRALYARLATISPPLYGAYLDLPAVPELNLPRRALLSISPELFLESNGGHVTTRPIKGTRPNPGRGKFSSPAPNPEYQELLHSQKDIAELNMIVDLMRNDLGKVCRYGSIRVDDARTIESHPTVHHGVATVRGMLHESRDCLDLLKAAMPPGSVTGAPKVRAMQIIDELEPVPRGPYCGAIGEIALDAVHLNVAIRTIQLVQPDPNRPDHWEASFHVGGGIVADSDPAAEYDETLTKAAALAAALTTTTPI